MRSHEQLLWRESWQNWKRKRFSGLIRCSGGLWLLGISAICSGFFSLSQIHASSVVSSFCPVFTSSQASPNSTNNNKSDNHRWLLLWATMCQALFRSTLQIHIFLNLTTIPWVRWCYSLYSTEWENEAQRGQVTHPGYTGSHGAWVRTQVDRRWAHAVNPYATLCW